MTFLIDPELKKWASKNLGDRIDQAQKYASINAAEIGMGVTKDTFARSIRTLKQKAASQGYSPDYGMTKVVPDPFVVKGVSTYHPETRQWVKSALNTERFREVMKSAAHEFFQDLRPVTIPPLDLGNRDSTIIPWFNIGDAHLGMLAFESQVRNNFNLEIAERELLTAFKIAIERVGPHNRCVLNDLGDFTHYENFLKVTERSGHSLDGDQYFDVMIKVYSRIMRRLIDMLLEKFTYVDVIINKGNHSGTNDVWMNELLRVAYAQTDRVNILANVSPFIVYRMGNTLVMTTHGDKSKPQDLIGVLSSDFREEWGKCRHTYIYLGHVHHSQMWKERAGAQIESFNTLAPADKWAFDGAYRSRQCLTVTMLCREYGDQGRRVVTIEEVKDRISMTPVPEPLVSRAEAYVV